MPEFDNNHYVQKKLLSYFSLENKINIYNKKLRKFYCKNISQVFLEKNLYDYEKSEDIKIIEKELKTCIEDKFVPILQKINNETGSFILLTEEEIEIIKKYVLTQIYRNKKNGFNYKETVPEGEINVSLYNKEENESNFTFWKREIIYILQHSNKEILNSNFVGIKKYAEEILNGGLLIIKTRKGFIMNDLGYYTERNFVSGRVINDQVLEEIRKESFDKYTKIKYEIEHNQSYLDNYVMMPISNNTALVIVHPLWSYWRFNNKYIKIYRQLEMYSPFLERYYSFPLITPDGKGAIYEIKEINKSEERIMNKGLFNLADQIIGAKTKDIIEELLKV